MHTKVVSSRTINFLILIAKKHSITQTHAIFYCTCEYKRNTRIREYTRVFAIRSFIMIIKVQRTDINVKFQ